MFCVYCAMVVTARPSLLYRLSWVPLLCLMVILIAINTGAQPVPYVLAAEYFPTSIRSQVGVSFLELPRY